MGDRRVRRLLLAALAVAMFGAAAEACSSSCKNGVCTDKSETRLIERVCSTALMSGQPRCVTDGDATATTGITADEHGFELGPLGGTLTIHLAELDATELQPGTLNLDVLVAAHTGTHGGTLVGSVHHGACMNPSTCPPDPGVTSTAVTSDSYHWVPVVVNDSSLTSGTDPTLTLTGHDLDIADIRASTTFNEIACSIRGPIGAR